MSAKVQVVKVQFPEALIKAKLKDNEIATYVPPHLAFAPVRPRIVKGKYGLSAQLVQYKQSGWQTISVKVENTGYIVTAVAELLATLASLELQQLLHLGEAFWQEVAGSVARMANNVKTVLERKYASKSS